MITIVNITAHTPTPMINQCIPASFPRYPPEPLRGGSGATAAGGAGAVAPLRGTTVAVGVGVTVGVGDGV